MWLIPNEQVVIIILGAIIGFILFAYAIGKLTNKNMTSDELLGIITNVKDIISGGLSMNNELKEFSIKDSKYYIEDNNLSLEQLVKQNDEDKDYEGYLNVVITILKERYKNFRFLRMSPTHGDFESGHLLSFTISREQVPVEYEYLFRLAISKGLSDSKINALFYDKVIAGEVLPLGDVEITAGTGLSSATQAEDITANIVFMPRDYYNEHLKQKNKEV